MSKALQKLVSEAERYEAGEMLRSDSEVEIGIYPDRDTNDYVWVCDYSPSRGTSEQIIKVCNAESIQTEQLIRTCNAHHWAYII